MCNVRKIIGREYLERHANRAQDVMLNKHANHVFKKGWIFRTALTAMPEMCFYGCDGGVFKITLYFKCWIAMSHDG